MIDPPETTRIPPEDAEGIPTGPPPVDEVPETPVEAPIEAPVEAPVEAPIEAPVDEVKQDTFMTIPPEPTPLEEESHSRTWASWFMWVFILLVFIILVFYYGVKYALNESKYVIKKNATDYKISLDELREDIKDWLRWWNVTFYEKMNQFFFRQHVQNGTFKMTKYKIPINLIPSITSEKNPDK